MGEVWRSPRFRTGWKSFENVVRRKLKSIHGSPSERNEYEWGRLFQQSLDSLEKHKASGYSWDIFETFRSVILHVRMPKGLEGKIPRLHVEDRTLTLSGVPGKLDETIRLPASVNCKKTQAVYASGIVEIRLRKKATEKSIKKVKCSVKKSPAG